MIHPKIHLINPGPLPSLALYTMQHLGIKHGSFLFVFVSCIDSVLCHQITQNALADNDKQVYKEWMSKLHSLLDPSVNPHMLPLHHTRAHALYLQVRENNSKVEEMLGN